MFAKSHVAPGAGRYGQPAVRGALLSAQRLAAPKWNFHKYLVSRTTGEVVMSHASAVDPKDPAFLKD